MGKCLFCNRREEQAPPLRFEGIGVWLLQRTVGDACPYGIGLVGGGGKIFWQVATKGWSKGAFWCIISTKERLSL